MPVAAAGRLAVPAQLRLVNYFPAHNGWTYMWDRWDPAQIDRDFARIAGLSANTVRVVVEPGTFGYPTPSVQYAQRLATVVRLAGVHGLHVELTLFDWWDAYGEIAQSQQWAQALLAPYVHDARVAVVELRNEIDPGDAVSMTWARAMMPFLHTLLPGTPLTLSVGANDSLLRLAALKAALGTAAQPDFWSFHYYGRPELALLWLSLAKGLAAPQPLFVGETGYVNGDSDPSVRSSADREDEQLHYFRTLGAATSLLGLPPPAPWILYDFSAGASPVRVDAQENHFGLFRLDSSPKPVVATIRSLFAGAAIDASFNGDFEVAEPGSSEPLPTLWRHHGAGVFARDDRVAHSGRASVSLSGIAGGVTARANFSTTPPRPWVTAGAKTTVAAWARGVAATGTTAISIRYFDGAGTFISAISSPSLAPGTTSWTRLSIIGTAPPDAVYLKIVVGSDQNRGRVWFDDVTLG